MTEKTVLKSNLVYSDDKKKRYLMNIEWDKSKKKAAVIMLSAGTATGIFFDRTTNNVLENLYNLGYGSVDVVNLYAEIGCNSRFSSEIDEKNLKAIEGAVSSADTVIFAVGTGHRTNKSVRKREKEVIEILTEYFEKCFCISDGAGQPFYHPLCPKVREWNLEPLPFKTLSEELEGND